MEYDINRNGHINTIRKTQKTFYGIKGDLSYSIICLGLSGCVSWRLRMKQMIHRFTKKAARADDSGKCLKYKTELSEKGIGQR